MEKPKAKIDSFEPANEDQEFKYPRGKERPPKIDSKKVRDQLLPELIKAFKDGLGDRLPEN